jgi:hypothetical protein
MRDPIMESEVDEASSPRNPLLQISIAALISMTVGVAAPRT